MNFNCTRRHFILLIGLVVVVNWQIVSAADPATNATHAPTAHPTTTPKPATTPIVTTILPTVSIITTKPDLVPEPKNDTTTTHAPTTPAPCKPCSAHSRHFDFASFVGGIILTGGLVVIGYSLWRYNAIQRLKRTMY